MRLAVNTCCACVAGLLLLTAAPAGSAAGEPPSRRDVQAVVQQLKVDPNLGGVEKEKTLRFKKTDEEKPDPPKHETIAWLSNFFEWLAKTARVAVWVVGALLVALVLVGARRWAQTRGPGKLEPIPDLPSHVRNLDIRPESLPDDIGAAASAQWAAGAHLPALSLLYRGALSRLVHVYAVPIQGASTEDECVALSRLRLGAAPGDFVAGLVGAWQLAVYGARLPEEDRVIALCRDFDLHLRQAPPAAAQGSAA